MDSTWTIIMLMKMHGKCVIIIYSRTETYAKEYDIKSTIQGITTSYRPQAEVA